jgi:methylmalonyl-CoA mutase cobalamin-binding domain/chain
MKIVKKIKILIIILLFVTIVFTLLGSFNIYDNKEGMTDVLLTGGGIIPNEDITTLNDIGVGKIFTPGTNTSDIAEYIKTWVAEHRDF